MKSLMLHVTLICSVTMYVEANHFTSLLTYVLKECKQRLISFVSPAYIISCNIMLPTDSKLQEQATGYEYCYCCCLLLLCS